MITILKIAGSCIALLALAGFGFIIHEIAKAPFIDDNLNIEEKDNGEQKTNKSADSAQD